MSNQADSRRSAFKKTGLLVLFLVVFLVSGCSRSSQEAGALKVGMVLDTGGDKDRGYNEYSLLGAKKAARESGIELEYLVSDSKEEYGKNIDILITNGADLIFTVGFTMAEATAKAANQYPDLCFVIMDFAYFPGAGCSGKVVDCYTEEGGLGNVTSVVFREDQPAYLGGVLAACMSRTGIIGIVAGESIPPVVRLAQGFEAGVRSIRPDIVIHKMYIPDFNDAATGYETAIDFIMKGADILFCPAGKTGLGGLRAAKETGTGAVGVDVDQYLTFPEAGSVLMTSVMKNIDVAAGVIVKKFAAGRLRPGIHAFDLKSDAVGLAPYHEWEGRIPQKCKDLVARANKNVVIDPGITLSGDR